MLPEDHSSGEAYKKGKIVKIIDEENVQVKPEGGDDIQVFNGNSIYPLNSYKDNPDGYNDMVGMESLSEAELLNNIRIRFKLDMIYTYVGSTLIVLNPYKAVSRLSSPDILEGLRKALFKRNFNLKDHIPHIYAISAAAMNNIIENKKNQAIVIGGESGAGKTESFKATIKFLTSLGIIHKLNRLKFLAKSAEAQKCDDESIEDKILACNPVLEAFGNAKTVRNDNSSRFGKYVSLLVEKDTHQIMGATISSYLLEKSRVIVQVH